MVDTTAQSDELQRIEALHRNGILGAPSEDIFDSITATAAAVCEAPIGVISLIESDRLWFLSRSGINNEILVSVTDTGPGFDADIEPFKAFESSKENGMGIGLSISRTIVESHDGRLWIEKNNSDGCTMAVALPITPMER